jgi:co-chaperonin GroES (HSP10)
MVIVGSSPTAYFMIKLTGNKIAAAPLFDPKMYGSLYIPDQAQDRCDQGIVKYVGPEVEDVCIGDHILFSGYTGQLLRLEGEGLIIILPEDFVAATIEYTGDEVMATVIPGLYFKAPDGSYFDATYEAALEFVTKGLEEAKWYQELKRTVHIRHPKIHRQAPKVSDYDRS